MRRSRCGFSLLEVILALAILVGAIAVLGELISLGTRSAAAARDLTQAQLLCESKMNEISAGIITPDAVQAAPFELDPDWLYSIELASTEQDGVVAVRVVVTQNLPVQKRPAEFALVRWLQDPGLELPEPADASSESTTSGTTSGSSAGAAP